jgi:succinyl-CoA synthetase beta subunit
VLGPDAGEDQIQDLIRRHGQVFIKPLFRGAIGKKGKAGLIGRATTLAQALAEKERLYFAEHRHGNVVAKANGVSFAGGVPAEHEVYFAITDDTRFRAPAITMTHRGGVDIEELELNPIRMRPGAQGRLTPVACDFKCGFDRDDPRVARLGLPPHLFAADVGAFEQAVNERRTHQGQSDVFVINERGTILAPTFGGGANSLVTEVLGEAASISSDFGGNPPYEKMKQVARICYTHFLKQSNVLFIIGGKSNNTDIQETLRAMGDALRVHFSTHGPTPLCVVVGRDACGGPRRTQEYKAEKKAAKELGQELRALPGVHHPVFNGKPVNHDPRERFIADFLAQRGDDTSSTPTTANWCRPCTTPAPAPTCSA